jgi:hypothetical protein
MLAWIAHFSPTAEPPSQIEGVTQEELESAKEKVAAELSRPGDEARRLLLDW